MISAYSHTVVALASAAIAASAVWWVQGNRYELKLEKLEHAATTTNLQAADQTIQNMAEFQKGLNDALTNFQTTQQRNAKAQQSLEHSLRTLRGTTDGLRGDFAHLPDRIASAAQPALAEYARACTTVFESMAAAGARLAERGAEVARAADGHAADAALMREAWPRKTAPAGAPPVSPGP